MDGPTTDGPVPMKRPDREEPRETAGGEYDAVQLTCARRQLHLPTGDNYTSPSLRLAGR
jgi:hypothetical protein